jgi:hypothetical protein
LRILSVSRILQNILVEELRGGHCSEVLLFNVIARKKNKGYSNYR